MELDERLKTTLISTLTALTAAIKSNDVDKIAELSKAYQRILRNSKRIL